MREVLIPVVMIEATSTSVVLPEPRFDASTMKMGAGPLKVWRAAIDKSPATHTLLPASLTKSKSATMSSSFAIAFLASSCVGETGTFTVRSLAR